MAQSTEPAAMSEHVTVTPRSARGLTAEQRRRIRITTWVVSLIALAFYFGFIILTVMRAHH